MPSTESEAGPLLDYLNSQALAILSSQTHQPLQPLDIGSAGQFPYYYTNPSNLVFNHLTYNWINTALKAGASPAQLGANLFNNEFIRAISSVVYTLSKADQATLNAAATNVTNQQLALLNAWNAAYGSIPPAQGALQPIDVITSTIATTWASPATTLTAMRNSRNLNALLNMTPASGGPILPVLANYLNAWGSSISLQNNVVMNNSYVQSALTNAQSPVSGLSGNGGLKIDDNSVEPAYTITPQLADIINALSMTSNSITLDMTVSRSSASEYRVNISGGTGFSIPVLDFFSVNVGGSASYFQDQIATSSNTVSMKMTYTGVNLVNFGPSLYNESTNMNWAFFNPIQEAIKFTGQDVSSFKFAPNPNIDFSTQGGFGYISGVAIANYPTVEITVAGSNYDSIYTVFQQQSSTTVRFLGIPLGTASESTYSSSSTVNASASSVTIKLSPPLALVAGTNVDSVGWVLGAQTTFPCA